MRRTRILLTLFARMFLIASFVIGGGFAIIAVADEVFSKKLGWTKEGELLSQLPVFQMVPGMIATNTAIYIGNKMAGPLGAAVAVLGAVLPSLIVFLVVTVGYASIPVSNIYLSSAFLGLRAGLTGIILAMLVRVWSKNVRGFAGYLVLVTALFLMLVARLSPALVVLGAALTGAAIGALPKKSERRVFPSAFWAVPLIFLKYGLVAFGGGYVLVPMYVRDFVGPAAPYLRLAQSEFANVMALTQLTPGAIGVNCATYFGYQMGGVFGSLLATFCLVLPGFCLLLLLLRSFDRFRSSAVVRGVFDFIHPVSAALMIQALWTFSGASVWSLAADGRFSFHPLAALIASVVFVLLLLRKSSVVRLVFASALVPVAFEACQALFR